MQNSLGLKVKKLIGLEFNLGLLIAYKKIFAFCKMIVNGKKNTYRVSHSDMDLFKIALRGKKIENFDDISLAAWS